MAVGKPPTDAECEETLRLLAAHGGNATAAAGEAGVEPRTFRDRVAVAKRRKSGMIVFQHPTLAARDAYAARGGWHALRSATAVTYHQTYGEVWRTNACPEMLAA